jgi:hypothetical protein
VGQVLCPILQALQSNLPACGIILTQNTYTCFCLQVIAWVGQTMIACYYLYMHPRDISPGNVLVKFLLGTMKLTLADLLHAVPAEPSSGETRRYGEPPSMCSNTAAAAVLCSAGLWHLSSTPTFHLWQFLQDDMRGGIV